jgi:hypothetical protein
MATTETIERTPAAPAPDPRRVSADRYELAVVAIAVLAQWIRPLGSSLWLDETGTFFVLQAGSFRGVVDRALGFQGQFPLYHVLLWGWTRVAGTSEVALRLPSVAAGLAAAWLAYRCALRLFDDVVVARLTAYVVVMLGPVAFAAADARPYALTLMVLVGATLALLRWLDTERALDGLAYVVLVAVTLYLHYLFGLALIGHACWILPKLRRMGRRGVIAGIGAAVLLAVLLAPAIPHLVDVYGRREAMSLFTYGSPFELLTYLVPPTISVAFLVARFAGSGPALSASPPALRRDVAIPLVVWLVVPPTTLFLVGRITGVGLWAERHFLSYSPALAMLAACAFGLLAPARRRVGVAVLATLFVLTVARPTHGPGDWREAAAAANSVSLGPDTPVFVYTGFSESRRLDWVRDPGRSRLFVAPFVAYPVEGHIYALPLKLNAQSEAYVSRILSTELTHTDRFVLITDEILESFDVWLADATKAAGFSPHRIGEFDGIRVIAFERAS